MQPRGQDKTPAPRGPALPKSKPRRKPPRPSTRPTFKGSFETKEAQAPATKRFLDVLYKNVDAALELARTNPGNPVAFEALKFTIRTNRAGPGEGTGKALKMILERKHYCDSDQRDYLAPTALVLFQYPDAEKVLRGVLDENPSRTARAQACYFLAHHLRQQAYMVRKLPRKPEEMKNYEDYPAAQPIAQLVNEKDPDALEKASESLLEVRRSEFGDVKLDGDSRTFAVIAEGELFSRRHLQVGKTAPRSTARTTKANASN